MFHLQIGLCQNLRAVPWYDTSDPDEFYPRCFKLDDDEERLAFIGEYLHGFTDKYLWL